MRGGNKKRENIIDGPICRWDSGYTNSTIESNHIIPYDHKIHSNKIKYSTATGPYCTAQNIKLPFFMPYFSISKAILYQFHIYNNACELGICFDIIIGRDMMVQLGLMDDFKYQVLQWDGTSVMINKPRVFDSSIT